MAHAIADDFPWQRLGYQPAMRPGKTHDLLRRSLRKLEEWEVPSPAEHRLLRAERLLGRWAETRHAMPGEPRERALIAEATRSAVEFYLATHCGVNRPSTVALKKFQAALGGADLPDDEEQHRARDIQFELYVHGLLHAGGVRPWFDESPDIRFNYDGQEIGVAVKRLWSQEGAHKNLSGAAAQVAASGIPGIVATNSQQYLSGVPADDDAHVRGADFNERVARLHGQFPYLAGKPHVLGLMVCGTGAEWGETSGARLQLRMASYNQLFVLSTTTTDDITAQSFHDSIGARLRDWYRENM